MQRETRIANIVVGALTTLSLILLALPLSSPVRSFKACVGYLFEPVAYEGEKAHRKLAEVPAEVRALLSADMENRRLQDELRATSWLKAQVDSLTLENERLRGALALKAPTARRPVWARVLERDPSHWYSSISVDAGADRGVSLNDAVLGRVAAPPTDFGSGASSPTAQSPAPGQLPKDMLVAVGRVVEVRPRSSTVLLLTDERSAVAAYLSSGTLDGLVQGQGHGNPRLRMNFINTEATIAPQDSVFTSPTSATFPPDLLIGRVSQVNPRDPFLAFQSVEISPALNAASMRELMILATKPAPSSEAEAAAAAGGPR